MEANTNSVFSATAAVTTVPIPAGGRRIHYRGYLVHAEIPSICYVIYGRNSLHQLTELGTVRSFMNAMRWVDRHLNEMRELKSLVPEFAPLDNSTAPRRLAA